MNIWAIAFLAIVFAVVCVLLILMVLIQKPRGGGLSGAFGGVGDSAQSVFGSKVGDIATLITVVMFVCFILLAMGMQWLIPQQGETEAAPSQTSTDPAIPGAESGSGMDPDSGQVGTDEIADASADGAADLESTSDQPIASSEGDESGPDPVAADNDK